MAAATSGRAGTYRHGADLMADQQLINTRSARAAQARMGKTIGKTGYKLLLVACGAFLIAGLALHFSPSKHYSLLLFGIGIAFYIPAIWWKRRLSHLPADGKELNDRLSGDVLARLKPATTNQPRAVWAALSDHWQSFFFLNHLMLTRDMVAQHLSDDPATLGQSL